MLVNWSQNGFGTSFAGIVASIAGNLGRGYITKIYSSWAKSELNLISPQFEGFWVPIVTVRDQSGVNPESVRVSQVLTAIGARGFAALKMLLTERIKLDFHKLRISVPNFWIRACFKINLILSEPVPFRVRFQLSRSGKNVSAYFSFYFLFFFVKQLSKYNFRSLKIILFQ